MVSAHRVPSTSRFGRGNGRGSNEASRQVGRMGTPPALGASGCRGSGSGYFPDLPDQHPHQRVAEVEPNVLMQLHVH